MNNKALYKTEDFVSFLRDSGVNVDVDTNPNALKIEKIKKLIAYKENLFKFQKSLFSK